MTPDASLLHADPPSRHANPFATCWTKPGAIPFKYRGGQSAETLVANLAARSWLGAIIGPHGSGKSTLLESLKPVLIAKGRTVYSFSLRDGQRCLPAGWRNKAFAKPASGRVLVIDGYAQLAWLERSRLSWRCRRAGSGLLVTSHAPLSIPTLVELSPDLDLIEQLVAGLRARVSTDITRTEIAASYACHGSNVREILFDLYDRHEQRRRQRVSPKAAS